MATRNLTVDLSDWTLLADLITTHNSNLGKLTNCQKIEIRSPADNADGTRVQISCDLVNNDVLVGLLKEESYSFESPIACNQISTIDKSVRIVDENGDPTEGSAVVLLTFI